MSGASRPNLLFVCRHGAAKSVLAAELAARRARELGIDVRIEARGLEPDTEMSAHLGRALPDISMSLDRRPIGLSAEDLRRADLVVTFDLEPVELPASIAARRWDGLPAVSDDPAVAARAIAERVTDLLDELRAD